MLGGSCIVDRSRAAPDSEHWAALRALVPLYRASTKLTVGDGLRTSFWHDHWLPGGPLSTSLSVLFSHTTSPEGTVARALALGMENILVPRLNAAGERELGSSKNCSRRWLCPPLTMTADSHSAPL
jgi:hypothetical protein